MIKSIQLFKIIFFFILSSLLSANGFGGGLGTPTFAGGEGSRGGGGGFVCFPNRVNLRDVQDRSGVIKDRYLDQIERLRAIEYFEAFGIFESVRPHNFLRPTPNDNPKRFLLKALDTNLQNEAPLFVQVLKQWIEYVDPANWSDVQLPWIPDTGQLAVSLTQARENGCLPVQLARRDAVLGSSSPIPFRFSYNRTLYDKMGSQGSVGILNQAMLILHEALYAMSAQMNSGLDNSESIRWIGRFILTDRQQVPTMGGLSYHPFRILLRFHGFERFYELFISENRMDNTRKAELQAAYRTMTNRFAQTGKQICETRSNFFNGNYFGNPRNIGWGNAYLESCRYQVGELFDANLISTLTPQEAFLYVADQVASFGRMANFESLLMYDVNDTREVAIVCRAAEDAVRSNGNFEMMPSGSGPHSRLLYQNIYRPNMAVYQNALSYCRSRR